MHDQLLLPLLPAMIIFRLACKHQTLNELHFVVAACLPLQAKVVEIVDYFFMKISRNLNEMEMIQLCWWDLKLTQFNFPTASLLIPFSTATTTTTTAINKPIKNHLAQICTRFSFPQNFAISFWRNQRRSSIGIGAIQRKMNRLATTTTTATQSAAS